MATKDKREDGFYEGWDAMLDDLTQDSWDNWAEGMIDLANILVPSTQEKEKKDGV